MAILQHYYTSYTNTVAGSIGFQVKAFSPGLLPDLQANIISLISYRIPPALNPHAIAEHPIALRYYYKNPHECILLCSQSIGNDDSGRPGNFFAHTLVIPPTLFTDIPPIFYWKSPFWQNTDAEVRTRPDSLSLLSTFDADPSLAMQDIWLFLAQQDRQVLFEKLLSAVIHSHKTQRRIIIIDTIEHIVLWIAAVSCFLPPDYRPLLSFATYHHDPYQAPYLIIGTTSGSSFRATAEAYMSFFILNAETGVTSSIEPSLYAQWVSTAMTAEQYETQVLPRFRDYAQHLPAPTVIDEQLDLYAKDAGSFSSDEIRATHVEDPIQKEGKSFTAQGISSESQSREKKRPLVRGLLDLLTRRKPPR